MPITTTETKTLTTEKKISRIDVNDDSAMIDIYVRYKVSDGQNVVSIKTHRVNIDGPDMLELCGISPRLEVPAGTNYYEAVRDRCYAFLTDKALWPEG